MRWLKYPMLTRSNLAGERASRVLDDAFNGDMPHSYGTLMTLTGNHRHGRARDSEPLAAG